MSRLKAPSICETAFNWPALLRPDKPVMVYSLTPTKLMVSASTRSFQIPVYGDLMNDPEVSDEHMALTINFVGVESKP